MRRCKIDFLITESIICHIYQTAFRKEEEKEAESKSETKEESQCETEENGSRSPRNLQARRRLLEGGHLAQNAERSEKDELRVDLGSV